MQRIEDVNARIPFQRILHALVPTPGLVKQHTKLPSHEEIGARKENDIATPVLRGCSMETQEAGFV